MSLLCLFIHNWHIVPATEGEVELVASLGGDVNITYGGKRTILDGWKHHTRVCKRCMFIDDRLMRYIERLRHNRTLERNAEMRYEAFRSNEGAIKGALSITDTGGELSEPEEQ